MSSELLYPYDEGDRLEQRNTYFFSPFHGQALLIEWANRRDRAIVATVGNSRPAQQASTRGHLEQWLSELYAAFSSGSAEETHRRLLAKLIQRFEVSKRLHGEYSDAFRPTDANDYHELSRYLEFAEVLVAAYKLDKGLPILNALLKCADTLCALRERLAPASQARLAEVIRAERACVAELAHSLGIPWPTT